jgi:hypothetical protein
MSRLEEYGYFPSCEVVLLELVVFDVESPDVVELPDVLEAADVSG